MKTFLEGGIDHGQAFLGFLEATEQKIAHGYIIQTLLSAFKESGIILLDGHNARVFEIGCGDGEAAHSLVEAILRIHDDPVDYYGSDLDERFVESTRRRLITARSAGSDIGLVEVAQTDLFHDDSFPFDNIPNLLATLGHAMYYVGDIKDNPDAVLDGIDKVIENLLRVMGENGVCVLTHNSDNCEMATLRDGVCTGITPKVTSNISRTAEQKDVSSLEFSSTSHVRFPELSDQQWDDLKDPSTYSAQRNSTNSDFTKALVLTTFVAHVGLKEVHESGKLGDFIDRLRDKIGDRGYIESTQTYQLLLSRNRTAEIDLEEAVKEAVENVKTDIPIIEQSAKNTYNARHSVER